MKLLLLMLVCSSFAFSQTCKTPVDKNKVVLFIDTNNSAQEIKTARAAACARGESLISLPHDLTPKSNVSADQFKAGLQHLKTKGMKPTSIILSGHDGGGSYSGETGYLTRKDITKTIEEFPEFKESVESLYLLGCYTGVKFEVFSWMAAFPKLRLIGGYEGSAPLSARQAGHDYLTALMLQEKKLSAESDSKKIQKALDAVKNINMLTSAIAVHAPACLDEKQNPLDFYFRSKPESGPRFEVLDSKDCVQRMKELPKNISEFNKYYNGTSEIPADTANGPLRQIYKFFRGSEHCFKDAQEIPSGDQVLALLFYNGYTANFGSWIEKEAKDIEKRFNDLTLEDYKKALAVDIASYKEKLAATEKRAQKFNENPEAYKKEIAAREAVLSKKMEEMAKSPFGVASSQYFTAHPDTTFEELPSPPFKNEEVMSFLNFFTEFVEVSMEKEQLSDFESTKKSYEAQINHYKSSIKNLEELKVDESYLQKTKESVWFPNIKTMTTGKRTDHQTGIHKLYGASNVHGIPQDLRKDLRRLSRTTSKLISNLQCMPLSWHEKIEGKKLEEPLCGVLPVSRYSGDIIKQNSMLTQGFGVN